jgi:RNA polymerase sigma-70 factor (ECF subfamily)
MSSMIVKAKPHTDVTSLTTDWTDEKLLLAYCESGEEELFAELVQRYERELYSYLRRYLGDAEMAEDAFQATFLQLHLKCNMFEAGRRLRPWLYMIATNKAIDLQRRNKRRYWVSLHGNSADDSSDTGSLIDTLAGDEPSPETLLDERERGEWVNRSLTSLPENLRVVVHLVYYQGLKYREAAEVLSIPVGTVKSRLHTAIMKLTEAWDGSHDECG